MSVVERKRIHPVIVRHCHPQLNRHLHSSAPAQKRRFSSRFSISLKKQKCLHHGSSIEAIPVKTVVPWRGDVTAAHTGPNTGLTQLDLQDTRTPLTPTEYSIAGCKNWNHPEDYAYGLSLTLYEEDRLKSRALKERGVTPSTAIIGDPIADVFGVMARENSCVLAIADGVNWGKKSRLAARCAVHAVMDHISSNIHKIESVPSSTTIAQLLEESVTLKAQELILRKHATLTTLSTAVVCEMGGEEWGLFVCAVGDSPVYVYCPQTRQVTEVTVGCHKESGTRDMRMAGGVLGPSHGTTPDLSNISYAFMPVYQGDVVFAVTDGISDNFCDKVIGPDKTPLGQQRPALKSCCESASHLTQLLSQHQDKLGANLSAQTIAACLMNHTVELTDKKRSLRTQCLEENVDMRNSPEFAKKMKGEVGKLDHATVVAYQVGLHHHS